jgi:hypothetical protein
MNIKSLRKNYESLTMLERLSLADNALARDDENELQAIIAASPRIHFSQVDYLELLNQINKFRFCSLITRLSYIMQFDFFCYEAELDYLRNKSSSKREERLDVDARMSAFLYVRATDSWKSVCQEFSINPDFADEVCELLYSVKMMRAKDELLRAMAFTEEEAQAEIIKLFGKGKVKTLEEEIASIKEVLGLPVNQK